jgi:hypothetical protein
VAALRVLRALIAAAALALSAPALTQPTDVAVKAAFLPRFAKYVTWPPAAMPKGSDPFVLCEVGGDPFGAQLDDAAKSQTVDGRRIVVRRMETATTINGCHIVYVGGSRAGQIMGLIGARPMLTVTDEANGGQRGIIHFAVVSGRVRFYIDQASAARRGMQISSRLLALAVGVRQ